MSCIAGKRGDSTAGLKEQDGEIAVTGKAQAADPAFGQRHGLDDLKVPPEDIFHN